MAASASQPRKPVARYEPLPGVLVRSPAFSRAVADRLYGAPDCIAELHALLRERPDMVATLRHASESLGHGIAEWLSREPCDTSHSAALPALAYVLRCSTRCTPLAACSGVAFLAEDGTAPGVEIGDELQRRTRPDSGWLAEMLRSLERNPEIFPNLRLWRSGLVYEMCGRLEVADYMRTRIALVGRASGIIAVPTSLNRTEAIDVLLAACTPGITADELASALSAKLNVDRPTSITFVAKMCELGVLVSELRIGPVDDPFGTTEQVLRRVHPPSGEAFAELRAALLAADRAGVAEALTATAEARRAAAVLGSGEPPVQVDAVRTAHGSLGDVPAKVADAIGVLMAIAPRNVAATVLSNVFRERYNEGREVPLLELLDSSEGLRFEDAVNDAAARDAAWRDDVLAEVLWSAELRGDESVELTDALVERLRPRSPNPVADSVEVIALLGRDDAGAIVPALVGGAHRGAYRSTARFLDMVPALEAIVAEQSGALERRGDVIHAELVSYPYARRGANVAVRPGLGRPRILCGVAGGGDPDAEITLDDVLVGESRGRIYLRSRSRGCEIRVAASHMLNPAVASRLDLFIDSLAQAPGAAFSWGRLATALPHRPRVTRRGVVLALANWRWPARMLAAATDEDLLALRARYRVPRFVCLRENDNRLFLDLDQPGCRALLREEASKPARRAVDLEEPYGILNAAATGGSGAPYVTEAALSFKAEGEPAGAGAASIRELTLPVARATYLRPPGGEWAAFQLYVGNTRTDYVLESRVLPLLPRFGALAELVHFLRYVDPDHHIRFRLKARAGCETQLLTEAVAQFGALAVDGTVSRLTIATYNREVERYGGIDCIDHAERVFHLDSVSVLGELRAGRLARREPFLLSSLADFAIGMLGGPEPAAAWLRERMGRRPRLSPEWWAIIKSAPDVRPLRNAADPRATALFRETSAIVERATPAAATTALRALLHMHCNRSGISSVEEEMFMHACGAVLDQLRFAQQATVR